MEIQWKQSKKQYRAAWLIFKETVFIFQAFNGMTFLTRQNNKNLNYLFAKTLICFNKVINAILQKSYSYIKIFGYYKIILQRYKWLQHFFKLYFMALSLTSKKSLSAFVHIVSQRNSLPLKSV